MIARGASSMRCASVADARHGPEFNAEMERVVPAAHADRQAKMILIPEVSESQRGRSGVVWFPDTRGEM